MLGEQLCKDLSMIKRHDVDGDTDWISEFAKWIPLDLFDQVLAEAKCVLFNGRKMAANVFIWFVIAMGLYRRESIRDILRHFKLEEKPSDASISMRRKHLGIAPMALLFQYVARLWCTEFEETFHGLRVRAVDGTCLRLADSRCIEERFGRPKGDPKVSPGAYPQLRMVAVMDLHSRVLRAAAYGPYLATELDLFEQCLAKIDEASLFVMDRGYGNWPMVQRLRNLGHHSLMRVKNAYGKNARVIEVIAPGDEWIEVPVSAKTRKRHSWMPKTVRLRRITWHEDGHRDKVLMTTLGPEIISAEEVIAAYRTRWEIEMAYDELKTHTLEEITHLRSRTADGVEQEVWAVLIAYSLIRAVMARAAETAGLPPNRIRYKMSLLLIRDFLSHANVASPGKIPQLYKRLLEDIASDPLPPRRQRSLPREAKKTPDRYNRKRAKSHLPPKT